MSSEIPILTEDDQELDTEGGEVLILETAGPAPDAIEDIVRNSFHTRNVTRKSEVQDG